MSDTKKSMINAYHETKRHSNMMFAYNVYPCTIPQDFFFVPMHWQDSVELIYIKRGEGIVQVDFETYNAKAGDVFVILPGHIHGLKHKNRMRMEYENIIFDMSFLGGTQFDLCNQKYWQPLTNEKVTIPTCIDTEHPLNSQVRAYLDTSDSLCSKKSQGYELAVRGNLLIIFSMLFQMAETKETSFMNSSTEKFKIVLARIEDGYDKKLTVEGMADECGYSASHFMRWFKEMTGTSFMEYLIEFRIGKAAQELKVTNDTILEIAQRTGFDNISNFNRLFKKRLGVTPSQFRKEE
ncbi:MAG: AraC family transcriptional regulator [Lachnospiraceae bacterium]|nr:AraC family transcriptional regulator [Lachnospiraceae bacterium]MEE1014761.1 AraC family transcriptional regulator [Lachnospiraceae bacterium]